ncbi:MAG TPA: response regulator [Candidatus Lokiarchaeia archaeon]|nr:response regulator [Candidatus Lokiarchaeia archaeon]
MTISEENETTEGSEDQKVPKEDDMAAQDEAMKTDRMKQFEEETGLRSVWRGVITETYKKWEKGEKVYMRDKERIALYVTEDDKLKWQDFIDKQEGLTLSKLIRQAVNFYINFQQKIPQIERLSKVSHDLKEPLTIIKGFTQLLLDNYKNRMDPEVQSKIKEIFEKSLFLESQIKKILEETTEETPSIFEVMIIDDDNATIELLTSYFQFKGIKAKGLSTNEDIMKEIKEANPKIILLDVLLPKIDGWKLCKQIKQDKSLSKIKVFFVTAVPGWEVEQRIDDTGADGYFLKPFDFSQLDSLKKYL